VTQTSGAGLEFISCLNPQLVTRCVSGGAASVTANNVIENSAFYDLGEDGVRIGIQNLPVDTDANVPQFTTVQNNVVEGYGRVFPNAWGIAQGDGHVNNPAYPADDYSLEKGSPGVGFVVFDSTQAGRSNPVIQPPAIAATFPTKTFNPATDF
jgi:hypothetical protein